MNANPIIDYLEFVIELGKSNSKLPHKTSSRTMQSLVDVVILFITAPWIPINPNPSIVPDLEEVWREQVENNENENDDDDVD
jgi:hypothetical protein